MADTQNKSTQQDPWLIAELNSIVDNGIQNGSEDSFKHRVNIYARKSLGSLLKNNHREQLEQKHPEFFKEHFSLDCFDPIQGSTVIKNNDRNIDEKIEGIVQISDNGSSSWLKPALREQGVIFGNTMAHHGKLPLMIKSLNNPEAMLRKSLTSISVQALSKNAILLFIPDNVKVAGNFIANISCSKQKTVVPIHLIVYAGNNSTSNFVINISSKEEKSKQMILALQNDFFITEHAQFNFSRIQKAANNSLILIDDNIVQKSNSHTELFYLDIGGKGVSTNFFLDLIGEGGDSVVTGVYRPVPNSRFYYDTEQNHTASHTMSDLLFKGVIGERGYASWKGNIIVDQNTKGANGYQANNNLIIAESAKVESIPGLEIMTDDVKCSHGVTISNIDKNHMFYLQSRGINRTEAKNLVVNGFLESSTKRLKSSNILKQIPPIFGI